MSNPSLPPVPMAASSSPLRRARDPHDDDDDEDALEEGELRFLAHDSDDTEDDGDGDDGRSYGYQFQPRAEYDDYDPEFVRRPQHHRSPPRRGPLNALDILLLGAGAGGALPSPTPSDECESDATLSDDDHHGAAAAPDAVGRGWAATGKRGWNHQVVFSDSDSGPELNTISANGEGQAGPTTSSGAQAAPTAAHHQQPPPPLPQPQPQAPRAPQRPRRERATEYTCKECGKSYPTNQALGGHAAGHKNKQREAEAMAAAAAGGDASLAAAFPLIRGGGKADKPHECRVCGKVFASGVALGGHMRVHYTGPPIVPARKNKKRCLAPQPAEEGIAVAAAPPEAAVGLSLALSIKAEENIAVAPPVAAAGLLLALSVKAEEESPSTPPAAPAGGAVRAVRLFGIDISPQVQQAPAPFEHSRAPAA